MLPSVRPLLIRFLLKIVQLSEYRETRTHLIAHSNSDGLRADIHNLYAFDFTIDARHLCTTTSLVLGANFGVVCGAVTTLALDFEPAHPH